MTNEEVMNTVKYNKEQMGEYELLVERKALAKGGIAAVVLCTAMILIELFFFKTIDFGKPALLLLVSGHTNMYQGKTHVAMKKRVVGIVELILAILFVVLYIGELML